MATTFDYAEELGQLRRAVSEPVEQLIVVEFDTLPRLRHLIEELTALGPGRAHVTLEFDYRNDTPAGLLETARQKLRDAQGQAQGPALLSLAGTGTFEEEDGAPVSARFWKGMNLAREAWDALGAQILLCMEPWTCRQAMIHADHLLAWAVMKIHLLSPAGRDELSERALPSVAALGDFGLSPQVARERWDEIEKALASARQEGAPAVSFLSRFFIPMLEAALAMGDLECGRQARKAAVENGSFPDEMLPRWHELNLALALAGHEPGLADEHAYKLLELAEHPDQRVSERALAAVNNQARLLAGTAHYQLAEPLYRRSLALAEKRWGPEHSNVAIRLNNLAQLLQNTNRFSEAESLMRRVLAIDEKSLGPDHPEVGTDLNNLASLLREMNRLAEAEPLMRRALVIDERHFGPDHPMVAVRLNNLGRMFLDTDRVAEAEFLMRRALAIHEKTLGSEHHSFATRLNNLAQLLHDTNRMVEAEPLMRRALAISEKSLGQEHPTVAVHLNNLASLLQDTNRLAEAEPLMRRALAIDEKNYGPYHPTVAIRLNNLARLFQTTSRLNEAETLMRRALAIVEKSANPEHPTVANCLNNLAHMLQAANRIAEAEPLMRRALVILLKLTLSNGHRHPHLWAVFDNYIQLLKAMSFAEAQIGERLNQARQESGFDPESFRKLLEQQSK